MADHRWLFNELSFTLPRCSSETAPESDPAPPQYSGNDQDGVNMLRETGGISYSTYLQVSASELYVWFGSSLGFKELSIKSRKPLLRLASFDQI